MDSRYTDLDPTPRVLLGPGPSMAHPRVLRAMSTPLTGYMDPDFLGIMHEVHQLLQFVFRTGNELTLAVPGTGNSAMDSAMSNLIEPGDRVLACVQGFFGDRLAEMGRRYGADVECIERPWGEVFDPDEIETALERRPAKLVTLVHAETSTGALQPGIDKVAEASHRHGALLVLDCVTSLGGLPVNVDEWGVDVAYSATQKSLSAPPGLAPITLSPSAREAIGRRSSPAPVFYLDLELLARYWSEQPAYHHTAPISTMYALREALRLVQEEGLETRFSRHQANAEHLWVGLQRLGLEPFVEASHRLPTLTTVALPDGIDDGGVRTALLNDYNIEIAGGFGPLAGKIWRIGLMGHSSRRENVSLLLAALADILG